MIQQPLWFTWFAPSQRTSEGSRPGVSRISPCGLLASWLAVGLLSSAAPARADRAWLAPLETDADAYTEVEIGEKLVVFFLQRMLGEAIVEKEYRVYQFDKESGELLARKSNWRDDLPSTLPPLRLSASEAATLAGDERSQARLYIISPTSDVFPLTPTPRNPCWVVKSAGPRGPTVTVIDAVEGTVVGQGVPPPANALSLTGPWESTPCSGSWSAWSENAQYWFNAMGYTTEHVIWPELGEVRGHVQSTETALFYELAHGDSYAFTSGCGSQTTAGSVAEWLLDYEKLPFTFLGSCDGMCDTGDNSFSFEFRKDSTEDAATIGYCGMSGGACELCWTYSLSWQHALFAYASQGYALKDAFDHANADYPTCYVNDCMRFAGDALMTLVPVLGRGVPDPNWGELVDGRLRDRGFGRGVAWVDYDNDGDLDLYLTNSGGTNRMLRNDGPNRFVDMTVGPLAGTGASAGAAWGDYDNDGDLDLYLANDGSTNRLLRNEGNSNFSDVTGGLLGDTGAGRAVAWADVDNDGYLDLYLVNAGGANRLFHNEGDGSFADATSGPLGDAGAGSGAAWGDYDNDGDLDLYLVNDGSANRLLRNDGGSVFGDVTGAPLGDTGQGRGVAWADHDNDGDLDLYVTNAGPNRLFRNEGGGVFSDATSGPLGDAGDGRGVAWADYDNDGLLDLYVVNYGSPNRLLRNVGGGAFVDATSGPVADAGPGMGAAWGDHDGDGDLDLYLANDGAANRLFFNKGATGNHWLQIDLVGAASNRAGIGARVRVVAGGVSQVREVSGGGGYLSQDSPTAEFGLGSAVRVDTLSVRWPSGLRQILTDVEADQRFSLPEMPSRPWTAVAVGPAGHTGQGRGAAWIDHDGDGDSDLYLVNHDQPNALLRNDGAGGFTDVTAAPLDDAGPGRAAAGADFDNDGDVDLYLVQDGSSNRLFRNVGDGTFSDVTPAPLADAGAGRAVCWADYDNDGKVDLYLVNSGTGNKLYRNYGDPGGGVWFFVAVGGVTHDDGPGSSAAWADYDNDGDLDLYLAKSLAANRLFQNAGEFGFWDVTGGGPLGDTGNAQSVAWGDYNNDGWLDLYVANDGNPDLLLRNAPHGFSMVAGGPLGDAGHGRGALWGDWDNDGDLDLYVSRFGQHDLLLRNDGADTFTSDFLLIPPMLTNANGVASADYDQDGDLDLYLVRDGEPNLLLRNELAAGRHWLQVDLVGTECNASAIGARVRVVTGSVSQMREISSGTQHLSQSSLTAAFGLGVATQVDSVIVTWPGGGLQTLTNVAVDQRLVITQGDLTAVPGGSPGTAAHELHPSYPNPFNPATTISYDLREASVVTLRVYDLSGRLVRVLLADNRQQAGRHASQWDGLDDAGQRVGSGVYVYRLTAGSFSRSGRVALVR